MGVPGISSTRSQLSETMYHSDPFQSSHSFCLAVYTLSLRLLGQSWPISSYHRASVPRSSAVQWPSDLNSGSSGSQQQDYFPKTRSVADNHQTKLLHRFLLPLSLLQSFLILWVVLLLFIHYEILLCPPFLSPPPHPRRGDLGHHRPSFTFSIFMCWCHTGIFLGL